MNRRVQLVDNSLQHSATITQSIPEFVVIGFGDLSQEMGLILLQKFPKQVLFFRGQPEFHHGNLHLIRC